MATKVLVIGGCYGGLSAALNLLDLCNGRRARQDRAPKDEKAAPVPNINVQITIVDERDGFCMSETSIL